MASDEFRMTAKLRKQLEQIEKRRGLLVAFEGPDGSGKTTQRKLFKMWLKGEGHSVETSKWNSSPLIKPLVKARKTLHALNPREFSLMHACDFRHRLENEILPALVQGKTVIADRYLFTALARDAVRGMDLDWLLNLYGPIVWPDVVFYFHVSPQTSLQRIAATRAPSYYESGQDMTDIHDPYASYQKFISQVIEQYAALAQIFQFVTIDAEGSVYDQHNLIRDRFQAAGRRPWTQQSAEAVDEWLSVCPEVLLA